MNFLILELCDNDYGHTLKNGLTELELEWGVERYCHTVIKQYLIEYVCSYCRKKRILDLDGGESDQSNTKKYLEDKLKVYFAAKMPTWDLEGEKPKDHDGGSVFMDLNTRYIGLF